MASLKSVAIICCCHRIILCILYLSLFLLGFIDVLTPDLVFSKYRRGREKGVDITISEMLGSKLEPSSHASRRAPRINPVRRCFPFISQSSAFEHNRAVVMLLRTHTHTTVCCRDEPGRCFKRSALGSVCIGLQIQKNGAYTTIWREKRAKEMTEKGNKTSRLLKDNTGGE